jgi:hypothetical protein
MVWQAAIRAQMYVLVEDPNPEYRSLDLNESFQ